MAKLTREAMTQRLHIRPEVAPRIDRNQDGTFMLSWKQDQGFAFYIELSNETTLALAESILAKEQDAVITDYQAGGELLP